MQEAELEKILKNVFSSININFQGRYYHALWREISESDGKTANVSFPWACASDEETKAFLTDWKFFYTACHKRLLINYVVNLYFFALVRHDDFKSKDCINNPETCKHTVNYLFDFFSKPENEQQETTDLMIKNGLFYENAIFMDTAVKEGPSTIIQIVSRPTFVCIDKGYISKVEPVIYDASKSDAWLKFPFKGKDISASIEQLFEKPIERGKLKECNAMFELIKTFLKQDYLE